MGLGGFKAGYGSAIASVIRIKSTPVKDGAGIIISNDGPAISKFTGGPVAVKVGCDDDGRGVPPAGQGAAPAGFVHLEKTIIQARIAVVAAVDGPATGLSRVSFKVAVVHLG